MGAFVLVLDKKPQLSVLSKPIDWQSLTPQSWVGNCMIGILGSCCERRRYLMGLRPECLRPQMLERLERSREMRQSSPWRCRKGGLIPRYWMSGTTQLATQLATRWLKWEKMSVTGLPRVGSSLGDQQNHELELGSVPSGHRNLGRARPGFSLKRPTCEASIGKSEPWDQSHMFFSFPSALPPASWSGTARISGAGNVEIPSPSPRVRQKSVLCVRLPCQRGSLLRH